MPSTAVESLLKRPSIRGQRKFSKVERLLRDRPRGAISLIW
jgi:hypothetical protein